MKKAFTLVELLVVIAVISLLMAIIVPVLHRVRQQGDETVCKSIGPDSKELHQR